MERHWLGMLRTARMSGIGLTLALAATMLIAPSAEAGPDLARAHAKATALRRQLAALQIQQSMAIERYDGVQDQLQQAVSVELTNTDSAHDTAHRAQDAQDAVTNRARALYMSGGQLGLMATILNGGTPGDVLERVQTVRSVVGSDHLTAAAGKAVAARAADVANSSAVAREQVASLRQQAAVSVAQVQLLLDRQRTLLHRADKTVLRLARAEQKAAEAKALADAANSGRAAGVPVASGDPDSLPGSISGPNAIVTAAIAAARSRLGMPYLWGATGPTRFDCSGLMLWSYNQAGVTLPRTSRAQYAGLPHVALSDLQPGDLVFYATNPSDPSTIHHVAMYLGGGRVIAAPHTGDVVRYAPVAQTGLMGAVRPTL
jgi:cell wall-associated NlpC family hydrolase